MPSDFLLVLDDLHMITNPAVYEGLSYFLTYMPSNMHLIMISRVEPPVKLARFRFKEDLVRIGVNELRFEPEEISEYYSAKGYFLLEEEIQKIKSYTEGWAAALVAVALSLKDEKNLHHVIHNFGSCNSHIENYLAEDVFNTWTKEHQEFMEETAILDRLCGLLCGAVTNFDGDRLLKELYAQNSFLVALDDEGVWFRYHHLFSDFLRKKLKKKDVALIRPLYYRAGEWLKTNGYIHEAINHFIDGSHYEAALPLIEMYGIALVKRREYSNLISWIDKLPDEYIRNSPIILIIKTTYFIDNDDFSSASKHIDYLDSVMKEVSPLSESSQITYLMTKSNYYLRQGDIEKLMQTIKDAAACDKNGITNTDYLDFNPYDISLYRSIYHILIKMLRKNSDKYISLVRNYRSLISENPGFAPLVEGEFYYESGRFDEALPKFIAAASEAVHANCPGALIPAMVTMAKLKRAQGDILGALEIAQECENRLENLHKPHWNYMLKAFKARLFIDMNNHEMLDQWMKENRLSLYQDLARIHEYELIVMVRVLIYKKRYDDATILLNRLLIFAEGLKRPHSVVEIANLLAITAMKNLKEDLAGKYLEKALSIGLEESYARSFADELSPMISLLEVYIRNHNNRSRLTIYAKELLLLTQTNAWHSLLSTDAALSLLTHTENKVFQLIIAACTNKEIAEKLGITVRTVKAHTASIYNKLDVKNRVQCIIKIKDLS